MGHFLGHSAAISFLQIGEHKYGKPILDRVVSLTTSLQNAQKAVLLSMDSTLRADLNLDRGPDGQGLAVTVTLKAS